MISRGFRSTCYVGWKDHIPTFMSTSGEHLCGRRERQIYSLDLMNFFRYHVLKGQKDFFFIPPTNSNLVAYKRWITSREQDNTFFPDCLKKGMYYGYLCCISSDLTTKGDCKRLTLHAGETLFIPGGWIHAVYTPVDSLVIGGNFLLSPCIIPQLKVSSCNLKLLS